MLKTDPFAAKNAADGVVFREGDRDAAHGDIAENDRQQECGQHENHVELPVLPDIHNGVVHFGTAAASCRGAFRDFLHCTSSISLL